MTATTGTDLEALTRDLFATFEKGLDAIEDGLREAAWDDLVMVQPGFPDVTGVEALAQMMRMLAAVLDFETIQAEVRHVLTDGSIVMLERVEHLRREDGSLVCSYPIAAVLEFVDGRIKVWREYFDTKMLTDLLPPEVAAMLADQ